MDHVSAAGEGRERKLADIAKAEKQAAKHLEQAAAAPFGMVCHLCCSLNNDYKPCAPNCVKLFCLLAGASCKYVQSLEIGAR